MYALAKSIIVINHLDINLQLCYERPHVLLVESQDDDDGEESLPARFPELPLGRSSGYVEMRTALTIDGIYKY